MFDGHGLLRRERDRIAGTAVAGFLLAVWAGLGFPSRSLRHRHSPFELSAYTVFDGLGVLVGLGIGFWASSGWWRLGRRLDHLKATQGPNWFLRAGAPRAIHDLLLLVAARDGSVCAREHDVVHRVLLRELADDVQPQDLKNWSSTPPMHDAIGTARRLAAILPPEQRQTVLLWCREVAAADASVTSAESELRRELTRILGSRGGAAASPQSPVAVRGQR